MIKVIGKVDGSYALGVLCADDRILFIAVRKKESAYSWSRRGRNFIASDIPAILKHTKNVYFLENNEIVVLTKTM